MADLPSPPVPVPAPAESATTKPATAPTTAPTAVPTTEATPAPAELATEPEPVAATDKAQAEQEATVEGGAANILPANHWTEIDDDDDSACGSDFESSTASITSSILAYRTINGRRYHSEQGDAAYWGANDEQSNEAAELWAHGNYLILGRKLFKAPLEKDQVKKVLDIGTSTGVWAMDFADEFPDSEVIGTDVSPIQPSWVPPNLKFQIEDCTREWTFANDTFDYVHIRLLYGSIPNWDHIFDEAYRVLKPGGWLETHEAAPVFLSDDNTVTPNSALGQWGNFFVEGGRKLGRTFEVIENDIQTKAIERLGMEDVHCEDLKAPVGAWPKDPDMNELGRTLLASLEQDYEGYATYMCNVACGWEQKEVAIYCAHVRKEIRNPKIHPYFRNRVVWARKPLNC